MVRIRKRFKMKKKSPHQDKEFIELHSKTIRQKKLLNLVYKRFYSLLQDGSKGKIVELGSGGGFIKEIIPSAVTSDIVPGRYIDKIFSAEKMPFNNGSIDTFLMLNTFHHIKDPEKALTELDRCLKPGGNIIMVEPYNTRFSSFVYKHFHYEGFNEHAGWKTKQVNRMESNNALPWIVFVRDRSTFEKKYPRLRIRQISLHTPLLFLLSGGLHKPQLIPNFLIPFFVFLEVLLTPFNKFIALYCTIEMGKKT